MEKNQEVTAAVGADNQRGTCGTRRWRGVDRDGVRVAVMRDVRRLEAQGLSRRAIARMLRVGLAFVARAQRAGGES